MLSNLLIVAGQVATLFLMMGVGFVLAKRGWFSEETSSHATHLLIYVVGSCIIIGQLQVEATAQMVRTMAFSALAMALTYVIGLPLVQLMFRREPADTRVVRRFGMIFANNSFMGLPLLASVLGDESLIFGVISMVVFSLFQWTYGAMSMGGKLSLRRAVINPGILSMAVGLFLFITGLRLPGPVNNAMGFVADLNTPLAMIVIGSQMARADILNVFKKPRLYLTAAVKLLAVPAVIAVVLWFLPLEPMAYCACVVLSACPTAGVTAMFAQMFRRDVETAAQMVTLSTLLSILTLPVFAVIAKTLSGLV